MSSIAKTGAAPTLYGKAAEVRSLARWQPKALKFYAGPARAERICQWTLEVSITFADLYDVLHHGNKEHYKDVCRGLILLLLALPCGEPDHLSFKSKIHLLIEWIEYFTTGSC